MLAPDFAGKWRRWLQSATNNLEKVPEASQHVSTAKHHVWGPSETALVLAQENSSIVKLRSVGVLEIAISRGYPHQSLKKFINSKYRVATCVLWGTGFGGRTTDECGCRTDGEATA